MPEEKERILEMKRKGELVAELLGMPLCAFDPAYLFGNWAWGTSGGVHIPACAVDLICKLHKEKNDA